MVQVPASAKEAEEFVTDYLHSKDEITKQVVTSKLKGISLKDHLAANSGRRISHGRVDLLYFK